MDIQNVRMNMGNASILVSGLYMAVFGNYPQKNLIFYDMVLDRIKLAIQYY